jgi:uncharacterized membrane protein YkvA (DUF1232 family)
VDDAVDEQGRRAEHLARGQAAVHVPADPLRHRGAGPVAVERRHVQAELRTLLIAAILLLATWALLVVAAKRLPPGILRDLAGLLPACLTTVRRLRDDPRVPRRAKVAVLLAGLWVLSPIDLLPEFLPVIGPLDDVLVAALALRYAARNMPRSVLLDAWPADPRLLERLLGPPVTPTQAA